MANGKVGAPDGNDNARKRSRLVGDTLRKVAAQNPEKLRKACEALMDKAAEGDIHAFREFRDSLDGKPTQSVDMNVRRTTADMDDSELARIISQDSSSRTVGEENGQEESGIVH